MTISLWKVGGVWYFDEEPRPRGSVAEAFRLVRVPDASTVFTDVATTCIVPAPSDGDAIKVVESMVGRRQFMGWELIALADSGQDADVYNVDGSGKRIQS